MNSQFYLADLTQKEFEEALDFVRNIWYNINVIKRFTKILHFIYENRPLNPSGLFFLFSDWSFYRVKIL